MKARHNPFRTGRILAVRYRPQGVSWDDLMARLEALGRRGAIVGREGSGKTTLLEDLAERLEARGFSANLLTLTPAAPAFAPGFVTRLLEGAGPRDAILLDGADAMGALRWGRFRRMARAAGALIVTAHRPGLLPTLIECTTSPELLAGIIREILGAESCRAEEAEAVQELAIEMFARRAGNLREALRELYDRYGARA